jgi:transposase
MKAGRPTHALLLTDHERDTLLAWTRRPKCPQALALRARLVLLCAAGCSNTSTAAQLNVTLQTVGKWRQRFVEKRLNGLLDAPRPGTPRKLSEADVNRVLQLSSEPAPGHASHWSTRLLAEVSGLSRASVNRICRAFAAGSRRTQSTSA